MKKRLTVDGRHMTYAQVAEQFGVHPGTVFNLVKRRKTKALRSAWIVKAKSGRPTVHPGQENGLSRREQRLLARIPGPTPFELALFGQA